MLKSRYVNRGTGGGWYLSSYHTDGKRTLAPLVEVEEATAELNRKVYGVANASRAVEVEPGLFGAWFVSDRAGRVRYFRPDGVEV